MLRLASGLPPGGVLGHQMKKKSPPGATGGPKSVQKGKFMATIARQQQAVNEIRQAGPALTATPDSGSCPVLYFNRVTNATAKGHSNDAQHGCQKHDEVRFRHRVSGVNYFFRSATIISPDRRQLLLRRRGAPPQAEGDSPPAPVFWFLVYISGAVGNWETCCWFSSFPSALAAGAVEMWESRPHLARFPRGSWKEGEARLWLSTLSTAPPFPQLTSVF